MRTWDCECSADPGLGPRHVVCDDGIGAPAVMIMPVVKRDGTSTGTAAACETARLIECAALHSAPAQDADDQAQDVSEPYWFPLADLPPRSSARALYPAATQARAVRCGSVVRYRLTGHGWVAWWKGGSFEGALWRGESVTASALAAAVFR